MAEQQVSEHERIMVERQRETLRSKRVGTMAAGADIGIANDHGGNGAVLSPTAPSPTSNGTGTTQQPASFV